MNFKQRYKRFEELNIEIMSKLDECKTKQDAIDVLNNGNKQFEDEKLGFEYAGDTNSKFKSVILLGRFRIDRLDLEVWIQEESEDGTVIR